MEPKLFDGKPFNQLAIKISNVAYNAVEDVLKQFGKDVVKQAKLNLKQFNRIASRRLLNSIKYEIGKTKMQKGVAKSITVMVSANAKSNKNFYGKTFLYGQTYEHGLENPIGGVKASSIKQWIIDKRIRPKKNKYNKARSIDRMAETISFLINTSGKLSSLNGSEPFLQNAIDKYYPKLEQYLISVVKKSIDKSIKFANSSKAIS